MRDVAWKYCTLQKDEAKAMVQCSLCKSFVSLSIIKMCLLVNSHWKSKRNKFLLPINDFSSSNYHWICAHPASLPKKIFLRAKRSQVLDFVLFENLRYWYWYWDLFRKSQVLVLVSFFENTSICIGIGIEMENVKYWYWYRYWICKFQVLISILILAFGPAGWNFCIV